MPEDALLGLGQRSFIIIVQVEADKLITPAKAPNFGPTAKNINV